MTALASTAFGDPAMIFAVPAAEHHAIAGVLAAHTGIGPPKTGTLPVICYGDGQLPVFTSIHNKPFWLVVARQRMAAGRLNPAMKREGCN
jgi:hypothetical protein